MTDSRTGEPIFYGCIMCNGRKGRSRKSTGSVNCLHESCRGVRGKRSHAEPDDAEFFADDSLKCFKIKVVLGVSTCLHMGPDERRVGRDAEDDDVYIQLRGGFGKSADEDKDDLIPDTRWVQLAELVSAKLDGSELDKLEKFAKALPKVLKDARRQLEERETDEQ